MLTSWVMIGRELTEPEQQKEPLASRAPVKVSAKIGANYAMNREAVSMMQRGDGKN